MFCCVNRAGLRLFSLDSFSLLVLLHLSASGCASTADWGKSDTEIKGISGQTPVKVEVSLSAHLRGQLADRGWFVLSEGDSRAVLRNEALPGTFFEAPSRVFESVERVFNSGAEGTYVAPGDLPGRERMFASAHVRYDPLAHHAEVRELEGRSLSDPETKAAPEEVLDDWLILHLSNTVSFLAPSIFLTGDANCTQRDLDVDVGINLFRITGERINLSQPAHQDGSRGVVIATLVRVKGNPATSNQVPVFPQHNLEVYPDNQKGANPGAPVASVASLPSGNIVLGVDDRPRRPGKEPIHLFHAASRSPEQLSPPGVLEGVGVLVLTFKPQMQRR